MAEREDVACGKIAPVRSIHILSDGFTVFKGSFHKMPQIIL